MVDDRCHLFLSVVSDPDQDQRAAVVSSCRYHSAYRVVVADTVRGKGILVEHYCSRQERKEVRAQSFEEQKVREAV